MEKLKRVKHLFQKYLDRTATDPELEEMFQIFEDRSQFESVYELFEQEWESRDVEFDLSDLSLEKVREEYRSQNYNSRFQEKVPTSGSWWWWSSGIAAGLVGLVLFFVWNFQGDQQVIYETVFGETLEVVLDDQSVVKLNANSKLVWNMDWQKTGVRKVVLEGEAFFNVKTITSHPSPTNDASDRLPFQVVTPDLTVNVHGTAFNVEARRQRTDVFLESGVVELELNSALSDEKPEFIDGLETPAISNPAKIMMKPGDAVSYSVAQQLLEQKKNTTTQNNASWTQGSLYFENERLENVLQHLEDIYGKQFVIADTVLLDRNVNLGIPFEDWPRVLGLMKLSLELDMEEVDGKIILNQKIE